MAVSVMLRSEHTLPLCPCVPLRILCSGMGTSPAEFSHTIEKVQKQAARWVCGVTWRPKPSPCVMSYNGSHWRRGDNFLFIVKCTEFCTIWTVLSLLAILPPII